MAAILKMAAIFVTGRTWNGALSKNNHGGIVYLRTKFHACFVKPTILSPICSTKKVQEAHTRLPSVGLLSWSRYLAVSLQVTYVSHKPGGRLPLLSARPAVTPATFKSAGTNFAAWWTEARWVWTVCPWLLPDSVAAAIWTRALRRLSPAR